MFAHGQTHEQTESKMEDAMARKAFVGDATHRLPRGKREPYRLWFEFLKLALKDRKIKVDRSLYKDWGDVANTKFNDWWEDHWRQLFAVPAATKALKSSKEFQETLNDPDSIVIRVSLAENAKRRRKDIDDAIADAGKRYARPPNRTGKARFEVTAKRAMSLDGLQKIYRMYQFWVAKGHDLEAAARAYYDWATVWNKKVENKKWNRKKISIPRFFPAYMEILDKIAAGKLVVNRDGRFVKGEVKSGGEDAFRGQEYYVDVRHKTRRYIRQAQKIAENVARGKFPGIYK
jgi:hypothetical protein